MLSLSDLHKLKLYGYRQDTHQAKNKTNPYAYISVLPNYLRTYLEQLVN